MSRQRREYVGTTATGGAALGNGDYGILIATQAKLHSHRWSIGR